MRYMRIGTGPPGESHFPIGGLIAGAISSPPGARPCDKGGACGVPGVIAVALATHGSVVDIAAIEAGQLDMAVVHADVAMWAEQGIPPFSGHPAKAIRGLAHLYSDQIHLVARAGANIRSPRDLRGKRVSMGEQGSGTLVHSRQVLAAWGLRDNDIKAEFLRSSAAADSLRDGRLDAFFVVDHAPVPSVAELARTLPITLVPLAGEGARRLTRDNRLLAPALIADGTYEGVAAAETLETGASLIVAASLPDDLVQLIAQALWQPTTVDMLAAAPPLGASSRAAVVPRAAMSGLGLPLHPGAANYYSGKGLTIPAP